MKPSSQRAEAFDRWIRTAFVQINTELESCTSRSRTAHGSRASARRSRRSCATRAMRTWPRCSRKATPATAFDSAFGVLGSVGLYLGALRRHELTNPAREERSPFPEASALAMHVGASLGPWRRASRPATSRPTTMPSPACARASPRCPTSCCSSTRTRAASSRCSAAADALVRVVPVGVSSPVADSLFEAAQQALGDVLRVNERLFATLDVERFFYSCARTTSPIASAGRNTAGANAGDFAGINEIDLLLGLCRASDPYYSQLLVDKMLFMLPQEQAAARLHDPSQPARRAAGARGVAWRGRLVPAQRRGVPAHLRAVRRLCEPASRPAGAALHRAAGRDARRRPPAGRHGQRGRRCRCCCVRSRRCATCAAPRRATTSRRATPTCSACGRLVER